MALQMGSLLGGFASTFKPKKTLREIREEREQQRLENQASGELGDILGGDQAETQGQSGQLGQDPRTEDLGSLGLNETQGVPGIAPQDQVELQAFQEFSQFQKEEQQNIQSRKQTMDLLKELRDIASQPKLLRGPAMGVFEKSYQQQFKSPLAPNVVDVFKKGEPDDLLPIVDQAIEKAVTNENFGINEMRDLLGNPQAATRALGSLNRSAEARGAQAEVTGKVPRSFDNKILQNRVNRLSRKRNQLQQFMAKYPNTKAASVMKGEIDRIDKQINTLEERTGPQSGEGRTALDMRRGLLSQEELAGQERAKGRGGKRTPSDIIVELVDKVGSDGISSLTAKEWDQLDILKRTDPLGMSMNQRMRDILIGTKNEISGTKAKKVLPLPTKQGKLDKSALIKGEIYEVNGMPHKFTGTGMAPVVE